MSDSDQLNPFHPPNSAYSSTEAIEALTQRIPLVKEILEGPPDQLLTNIQKLNLIPEAEKKSVGRVHPALPVRISKGLVDQLNKVINWSIDHENLYSWLKNISQFIPINLNHIYKNSILGKIENGLTFIEFLQRISQSSPSNRSRRGYETVPAQTTIINALQSCYKVTKSDAYKEDADFVLYNKRFDCLNSGQKLRYRIKLLRHLIAISSSHHARDFDPLNPAPLLYSSSHQRKEELLADVDQLYEQLEDIEYEWLLDELLDIDCPKTVEYKKIISCLDLKSQESEQSDIKLQKFAKIRPHFITKNVLLKCFKVQRETQSNLLSEGNTREENGKIYLKYDISQLSDVNFEYISSKKSCNQQNFVQESHKKHLSHTFEKLYFLIKQANEQKPILVYENFQTFKQIAPQQLLDVIQFCIKMIAKSIDLGMALKKVSVVSEILLKSELVTHFNMVLDCLRRNKNDDKCNSIFVKICKILQDLVVKNEEKILIMNNKDFLNFFTDNLNRVISDQKLKTIPASLQSFLINYIPNFVEFGFDFERVNLTRLYELQLNGLSCSKPRLNRRDQLERMMMMDRLDRQNLDMDDFMGETSLKRDKLKDFISVFPGCISYFSEKLETSVTSIQQQLTKLDVFDSVPSQHLQSILKLFVSEQIPSTENLSVLFKNLLDQHPSIFVKASQSVNFTALKNKLNVKEEQISACLLALLTRLRQSLAVESLLPEELCEKITSSKQQIIELANSISHLNLLLKMRQVNPACPFINQLLEISLIMEKIQTICLNKIVKYQAQYSKQKLAHVKQYYNEVGDKNILYFTISSISKLLFETCWEIFEELDIPCLDILLKELKIYFEAVKNLEDKNLQLRLLKKIYRNLSKMNNKTKINLNLQLYNHNKQIINEVLGLIYKEISSTKVTQDRTAVMGNSYLRFIEICKKQDKNPAAQFNVIIIPHIQHAVRELIDFIFFEVLESRSIFNNKQYRGAQNTVRVIRSISCDIFKRISQTFDKEFIKFYKQIFTKSAVRTKGSLTSVEQQITLEIQEPADPIKLVSKEQKQKITSEAYIGILDKIYEQRYQKPCLKDLQALFFIIIERLTEVYKLPGQEQKLLKSIIEDMISNSENEEFDQEKFKMQCSWIDGLVPKVKGFSVSVNFIQKYLKLISFMLNNLEEYKESIPSSIIILETFLPKKYAEDRSELIGFALSLLQVILKVVECSLELKKVNIPIIQSIGSTLINSKCSEFNHYIQQFLGILIRQGISIGPLLSNLIQKQSQLPGMEADLKAVFLKQSQNLVDESQDKISIRLNTFINIFKFKYGDDVTAFSKLTGKFITKNIKNDDKKETVYLCYDKRNSFYYSELLKKNFSQFEPSDNIKAIIKDLLEFTSKRSLKARLGSLRDLLYYSPLMIPYVMLHPVESQRGQQQFIDYLVTEMSSKMVESILNFLEFVCLDHSCLTKLSDRTIFFSQYLSYRIIKQIIKLGINKYTLTLIYNMSQLKRFAYLCKIKVDLTNKCSLSDVLIKHLTANREGYHYKNCDNTLVYLILAIVFKQDGIDNLKKCFVPKRNKQFEREYKLINESLIPYNVYFRKVKDGKPQEREENISFTGNLITPFYPEVYEDVIMDEDYKSILKSNYILKIPDTDPELLKFQTENLKEHHLKSCISVKDTKKYERVEGQLITELNQRHLSVMYEIYEAYFKSKQQIEFEESTEREDIQQMEGRSFRRRRYRQRRREGGFDRNRYGSSGAQRRNRPYMSRYAQQDFYDQENPKREEKKTVEKEFELSLNAVPSEQAMKEETSTSNFNDIKTGEEELDLLLSSVNDKLFLLGKDWLSLSELKGQNFAEKKSLLELKNIELDFDYHKISLWPHQFEEYCQMNAHKFEKLDFQRRESVRISVQKMLTPHLQRTQSSDSMGYIIDTIDENHQYLNISRTLSRSESLSSQGDNIENEQEEAFLFESNQVPIRAFSDIQDATLYELLLSFYYVNEKFPMKNFVPFLENKKSQSKLINTLLHLMKDPFSSENFPKCIYRSTMSELSWNEVPITQRNLKQEREKFVQRVVAIFESVKNYSFHQDDKFLLAEISNEGLLDIRYEPIAQSIGKSMHIPILQILQYGHAKSIAISLLKGVKQLPESKMDQIIELLQKSEVTDVTNEEDQVFRMGRAARNRATNSFPYQNIKELYKNQLFQAKFRNVYTFGTKNPTPPLLTHLIQSGIYTNEELKLLQLQFLASPQQDNPTLVFLNKVIQVYTDQELKEVKWTKDYKETIAKVIDFLNRSQVQIDKQPISRILKLTNDLGFNIKRALFERQMSQCKRNLNFDYYDPEKNQVIAKRKKGIFQSAFQDLRNKPDNFWLSPFSVKFIDENVQLESMESGFGNGVRREWFTLLSKAMVNLNYALFKRTQKNYYFFNSQSRVNPRHLQYFEFIGKLFGFSLAHNSIFVSPSFSIMLYKLILGEDITFEDIADESGYHQVKSMMRMKQEIKTKEEFAGNEQLFPFIYEDKKLLSTYNFALQMGNEYSVQRSGHKKTIALQKKSSEVIKELHEEKEQNTLPERVNVVRINQIIQLKPGGSKIFVTFDTMQEFIDLSKKKILEIEVEPVRKQFDAFVSGFKRIINPKIIARFTAKELKLLVEGVNTFQIEDLRKYTKSNLDQETASLLWSALEDLSGEDWGFFLWNWTGVDKMAAEGARIMGLTITLARGPNFIAHTCSKHLEVPKCRTKLQMETAVTITLNNIKSGNAIIED